MNRIQLALASTLALAALAAPPALADAEERGGFVTAEHRDGTIAINPKAVLTLFHGSGSGKDAQLRIILDGGPQTLEGAAADAAWAAFHDGPGAKRFLFVSHLGGTLGIPVRSIQTLYRSGSGSKLSVRIVYDGQEETVTGDEAERVWSRLAR